MTRGAQRRSSSRPSSLLCGAQQERQEMIGMCLEIISIPEYMTFVHVVRLGNNA